MRGVSPPGAQRFVMQTTPLDRFTVPLGGQDIELQDVLHDSGGMHLLRIRIREQKRFTIFDIDPATALRWSAAMAQWASTQPLEDAKPRG